MQKISQRLTIADVFIAFCAAITLIGFFLLPWLSEEDVTLTAIDQMSAEQEIIRSTPASAILPVIGVVAAVALVAAAMAYPRFRFIVRFLIILCGVLSLAYFWDFLYINRFSIDETGEVTGIGFALAFWGSVIGLAVQAFIPRIKLINLREKIQELGRILWKHRYLYMLAAPGFILMIIFSYMPMPGIIIGLERFRITRGMTGSDFVGFDNFVRLFDSPQFFEIMRNTLTLSFLGLVFFPAPIILALMLNEVVNQKFKRFLQTVYYLPHFLSWVIVVSLTFYMLSSRVGVINNLIASLGGERVPYMLKSEYFYPIVILQSQWKSLGWGTIIYLAAMSAVDPALYEAAEVDGAGKLAKIRHVTIPSIMPTVALVLTLSMGGLIRANFEQMWLMRNELILSVAEVIDTYQFQYGVQQGNFSYSAAVGLFQSVVSLILILTSNWLVKRMGQEGIW
jgi:putative aldouronate transport system permease protein